MATLGLLPAVANADSPEQNSGNREQRPNIIFILCDDMGYGDLGCYGQKRIETPNLDRMAQEGMRFTQAYAGSPVSAPSRASFMTGQHTGHTHVRGNREYWRSSSRDNMYGNNADYSLIGQEPYLMNHKIIPEVMKEAGYNTGMFGKWAGGYYNIDHPNTYLLDANGNSDTSKSGQSSSASLPNKRGIDCYYGYICQFQAHTYYPNFLNRYDPEKYGDEHVVVDVLKENIKHKAVSTGDRDFENRSQYTSDLIHHYALEWIDRQAEKDAPFLGIFTYTLPHAELWQPQDELVKKYKDKFQGDDGGDWGGDKDSWYYRAPSCHAQFAAMVNRLDNQVGEIFQKLEDLGIADNTLVIFTSDNGPHAEGGADPTWFNSGGGLRGIKRATHEGGVRIPFIAKGPGVPAGVVNDHQLAFYDIMPTLLDYAGEDGSAYSLKASTAENPYDGISFYNTLTGNDAEQEKHEFLYWEFHETNMMALRMGNWKLVVTEGVPALYDLSTDIHEDNDLSAQNPQVVAQMIGILLEQHTNSSLFSVTLPEMPSTETPETSVVVTQVKPNKLYTLECQTNDNHSARFISDTDGTLNGQSADGTKFSFKSAEGGGYYIKSSVSGKYINVNDAKNDVTFDAEPKTAWTMGQINQSNNYVYFTIGDNKFLNNFADGDKLQVATHTDGISGTNKCSLWTLHEYEGLPELVDVDKIYTLRCQAQSGHKNSRYISDNGSDVDGTSSTGTKFRFERSLNDNCYYIRSEVSGKYLNATEGAVTFDAEKATAWTVGKLGDYFHFHSGTGYLNNAGGTTSGLHMPNHGGAVDKDRHCSLWTLEEFDAPIEETVVPSGFYRIMHTASGRYLSAPATLSAGNATSDYFATFTAPGAGQTADAHSDIWYIENLGTDATEAAQQNVYIYKIWCFQSGYGLSTNSYPGVFGSFGNQYCPRLYSVVNTGDENYTIAGHYYDNHSLANSKFGLSNTAGSIGTKSPIKPENTNYEKLSRDGSAEDADSQWKLYPVDDITKSVSIGSIGVATFAFTSDTSIPEGVVAYSATAKDEDCISLVKVNSETIPARQGVILRKTDEGKQNFIFTAVHGVGTPIEGNLLKGTLAETALEEGDYILAKKKVDGEETEELVFGRISEASNIAAGKAYLPKDAVQARGFYPISWGDMETSVEEIPIMMDDASNNGLYIIDGQILIVRDGVKYNAKGQRVK